jgi:hypothetical protein
MDYLGAIGVGMILPIFKGVNFKVGPETVIWAVSRTFLSTMTVGGTL